MHVNSNLCFFYMLTLLWTGWREIKKNAAVWGKGLIHYLDTTCKYLGCRLVSQSNSMLLQMSKRKLLLQGNELLWCGQKIDESEMNPKTENRCIVKRLFLAKISFWGRKTDWKMFKMMKKWSKNSHEMTKLRGFESVDPSNIRVVLTDLLEVLILLFSLYSTKVEQEILLAFNSRKRKSYLSLGHITKCWTKDLWILSSIMD